MVSYEEALDQIKEEYSENTYIYEYQEYVGVHSFELNHDDNPSWPQILFVDKANGGFT